MFTFVNQIIHYGFRTIIYSIKNNLSGRYLPLESIEPILQRLNTDNQLSVVGKSVLQNPIAIRLAKENKILLWSQMHGNESTTTKALFDFLNVFAESALADQLLRNFVFLLNRRSGYVYALNANEVDLNRDSQNLTQPEQCCEKYLIYFSLTIVLICMISVQFLSRKYR
jgi:hypothetical protein